MKSPIMKNITDIPWHLLSFISSDSQLLLSSSSQYVKLWDGSSFLSDQVWDEHKNEIHEFYRCKAARFSHSVTVFVALSSESGQNEILLYDIQTCQLESKLSPCWMLLQLLQLVFTLFSDPFWLNAALE